MLVSNAAMLYQFTTKSINKAMKRNINRFSEDFLFSINRGRSKIILRKIKILHAINIYYNIFKDCGGSLRTTPRSSRYNIIYYSFFG